MPKLIISFSLETSTINKIDICSEGHKNRSDFIDWLAENNFFLNKETLQLLRKVAEAKSELKTQSEVKQH